MYDLAAWDLRELSQLEYEDVTGGEPFSAVMVGYATLVAGAMGAGFVWGYENLGPVFNRYF
ncbi:MAG: hypothetical protein AMXMBFR53_25770 [Gemmatimonadota bacterium]